MIKQSRIFLITTAVFAVLVLILITVVFCFGNKIVSPKKLNSEADQIKQANAEAVAKLSAGQTTSVKPIDKSDFLLGKSGAKHELIVYLDFDCPFCRQYWSVVKEVNNLFGNDVSIALRHYTLDSHAGAMVAAEAFECAREQDQALPMIEALFDNQLKNDNNTESILADAHNLGLKEDQFKDCLTSHKYQAKILAQKEEAKLSGVIGTPTSFLDGRNLPGAYQLTDFTDSTGHTTQGLSTLIKNLK